MRGSVYLPHLCSGLHSKRSSVEPSANNSRIGSTIATPAIAMTPAAPSSSASSIHRVTLDTENGDLQPPRPVLRAANSRPDSVVNLAVIVGERKDFALQQVDPFFTDSDEAFYNMFRKKLDGLNSRNSTTDLCTEEYIVESTRSWFSRRHDAKIGTPSMLSSVKTIPKDQPQVQVEPLDSSEHEGSEYNKETDSFELGEDFVQPTGLRR